MGSLSYRNLYIPVDGADGSLDAPGAIQSSGALVCFNRDFTQMLVASANLDPMLGLDPGEALGRPPRVLNRESFFEPMVSALNAAADSRRKVVQEMHWPVSGAEGRFQVSGWRDGERVVLEFEPLPPLVQPRILAHTSQWLNELAESESEDELFAVLVAGLTAVTGYERIQIYRFDRDWQGSVVAENEQNPLASHLGLRFPASAISPWIRARYDANPVRAIPDATVEPVPLLVRPDDPLAREPLDLSPGVLLAVPPVERAYLNNMGVAASLSFALHGMDGLWGVASCHHATPMPLSPTLRDAALTLCRMASQRLAFIIMRAESRYQRQVLESRSLIAEKPGHFVQPDQLVTEYGDEWLQLTDASGACLIQDRWLATAGEAPSPDVLFAIKRRLIASHHDTGAWESDCLAETVLGDIGDLADCVGLLAIPLPSVSPSGWLFFFRRERRQVNRWAGDPGTGSDDGEAEGMMRGSFGVWEEEVRGRSLPWTERERRTGSELAEDLAVAVSITQIRTLNSRLKQTSEHYAEIARTDALTAIWNRYYMEEELNKEIAAAERYGRPCSVVLFDIDHFKVFNDNFGHDAGDHVLKTVSACIDSDVRAADHFGRWGGEEFILLAGNTPEEEAAPLAERIRQQVEALDFEQLGTVTVSLGVAQWQPGNTWRELVARADQAMYRAKTGGRNRLEVASWGYTGSDAPAAPSGGAGPDSPRLLSETETLTALDKEVAVVDRYGQPLSLILFQIDDPHGPLPRSGKSAGGRELTEATLQILLSALRGTDKLGRVGDCFAVIACNTGCDRGLALAERLRQVVRARSPAGVKPLTLSAAVGSRLAGEPRQALVRRVGAAMTAAEPGGKPVLAGTPS